MRQIKYLVVHCTAGPQTQSVETIKAYWKKKFGWTDPGYHVIIKPTGEAVELQPIEKPSNGVKGFNQNSIHISYIGGVDAKGKALDNRTDAQKETMFRYLKKWKEMFPDAIIQGHRDFSPDVNKNGIVDPWERIKECPCFDAKKVFSSPMFHAAKEYKDL